MFDFKQYGLISQRCPGCGRHKTQSESRWIEHLILCLRSKSPEYIKLLRDSESEDLKPCLETVLCYLYEPKEN